MSTAGGRKLVPTAVLLLASLFFAYDIAADLARGEEHPLHVCVEGLIFLVTVAALWFEWDRVRRLHAQVGLERERVARLSGELFEIMQATFTRWQLTDSEREVALLLIKGLSMQEIADLRKVKEKTVRRQAMSIYAKSGYAGRHELASHFIEDLLDTKLSPL